MIVAAPCAARVPAGQALVECLIGCLLLVPLWWFVQHWMEGQAHRAALQSQLRVAVLRESLAPGRAGAGDAAPMPRRAGVSISRRRTPALAGSVERSALALVAPVESLAPGRLELRRDGWIRIDASVDAPPGPFWRRGPQRWREALTLLVDDWSLPGPRAVERRTQTLLPTTPLEPVIAMLGTEPAAAVLEPALRATCARRVDPEVVPDDRLAASAPSASAAGARSGWRPRC